MKEFWVKYDFEESKFGRRPNWIKIFKTRKEAEDFMTTTTDGIVVEVTLIEC